MSMQNVVPAYRSTSTMQSPGSKTETTTARAALMKQIQVLQKQEMALGEKLAALDSDDTPAGMQQRMSLQQQMQRIEEQIAALQTAMLQKDADRTVKVTTPDEPKAPAEEPAEPTAQPKAAANDTVGTLIDTEA